MCPEWDKDANKYFDLFDRAPVGYLTLEPSGRIREVNQSAAAMLGFPARELIGRSLLQFIAPAHHQAFYRHCRDVVETGQGQSCEVLLIPPEGTGLAVQLESAVARSDGGEIVGLRTILTDITELKGEIARRQAIEADLKAAYLKLIREQDRRAYLAEKLVKLLERERRDIGTSLQEQLGQTLVAVGIGLEQLKADLGAEKPERRAALTRIQGQIRDALADIRNISDNLRSDVLDHFGLVPAIRTLMENVEARSGIRFRFFTKQIPERMGKEKELALYRIAQECINNILRHARAKTVFVNLLAKERILLLTIEDDGIGFENTDGLHRRDGSDLLGLIIMQERAAQLGGELRIESGAGKGTHVQVELPL